MRDENRNIHLRKYSQVKKNKIDNNCRALNEKSLMSFLKAFIYFIERG